MSSYSGVPVEISAALSITFPVDKLVDQFVANMFGIKVDFDSQSKEDIQKKIYTDSGVPDVNKPGMASLVDTFIRLIIKAIGSFAQQIFMLTELVKKIKEALLNPTSTSNISFLAGIPSKIGAIIDEVKTFFSDLVKWIMDKFLGALGKIKIPIPAFEFDILGFKLPIPEIDLTGALKSPVFTVPETEKSALTDIQKKIATLTDKLAAEKKAQNIGGEFDKTKTAQTTFSNSKTTMENNQKILTDAKNKLDNKNKQVKNLENKNPLTLQDTIDLVKYRNEAKILNDNYNVANSNFNTSKKNFETAQTTLTNQTTKVSDTINKKSATEKELEDVKAELKSKLAENPVSAFIEGIKDMVITIVKFPIDFLLSLFKQLISALTGIVSFDFGEFEKLLGLMKPNVDSITELIVTAMDGIISGFSKLYKAAKAKYSDLKSNLSEAMEYLSVEGNKILGLEDTDDNKAKLKTTIGHMTTGLKIALYFPALLLGLIIELFNYALNPIGIKIG